MDVSVTWYANGERAVVADGTGRSWWVAPDGFGGYTALCEDPQEVRLAGSLDAAMRLVLGDDTDRHMAGAA